MKIGLLGAGWFGREAHIRNLLTIDDVQVTAVSSRSEESCAAAKELVGAQLQTFEDWRHVIDTDVDAVIVALTNDQHCEATVAAFDAGKHVLCEKPLGLTLAECHRVVEASQNAGKVLQIGHEMRHQALYQQMKSMVVAGDVGDPRIMWCREYRGPMRPGWRSSEEKTGGMLLEKNCHHFDLFNWILNAKPLRVAAFGGRDVLANTELLDNAQVLVEYEGGRRAVLEICLFSPSGGDCEIGITGSRGRINTLNQAIQLDFHRFEPQESRSEKVPDPDDEKRIYRRIRSCGSRHKGRTAALHRMLSHWRYATQQRTGSDQQRRCLPCCSAGHCDRGGRFR